MNIQIRLVGIAMLSVVSHDPAAAASICVDRRVAIAIGELSQQVSHLLKDGAREKAKSYRQMADQLAKANCVLVGSYPPPLNYTKTRLGCLVFSGDTPLSGGQITRVYWSRCPEAVE